MPAIPRVSYGIGSSGENACEDWLAVCAVSIEPCSGGNSLLNRENTGNFRIFDADPTFLYAIRQDFPGLLIRIPYAPEQGTFRAEQGMNFGDQGSRKRPFLARFSIG
jgi:hypothetical protein